MNWLEIAKTYEKEFIEKTTKLLQYPTLLEKYEPNNLEAPFGIEMRKALDYLLTTAEIDGFKTKDVFHYAAHIEMGEGDEVLGVLGHVDVVPAGGKWDFDPFSATLKDGKIYARGAMDDKGPTMAAYIAMRMIQDQKIKLNKKVRLIIGCDEESGMRCIETYLEHEQMPDLGFSPDAEFPLIYGEKGIFSYDVSGQVDDNLIVSMTAGERYNVVPDECVVVLNGNLEEAFKTYLNQNQYQGKVEGNTYTIYGKNSHAAWPHLGVNAIFLMTEFLVQHTNNALINLLHEYYSFDYLGKNIGIDHFDHEMKELTLNLALIRYENGNFRFGVNIRYPKGVEFEKMQKAIKKSLKNTTFNYVPHENSPTHYVSPQDPLVKVLYETYQKYANDYTSPMITIGGGTYARHLKKAVAFGPYFPGQEDLAHQANEHLVIDKMLVAAAIYAESIVKLAGEESSL